MKPKDFKEVNVTFAKDQSQYNPLPAFKNKSNEGEVIFCMGLSFTERIRVLFNGEIWVSLMTFNKPLTPSYHSTQKKDVLNIQETS